MTFEDFFVEFDIVEICHLSSDTFEEELHLDTGASLPSTPTTHEKVTPSVVKDHRTSIRMSLPNSLVADYLPFQRKTWSCLSFEGQWIANLSSGGRCVSDCDHGCDFWTNPQYEIEANTEQSTMKCALVISLMQKFNRLKPTDNPIDRYDYIQVVIAPVVLSPALALVQARVYKIRPTASSPKTRSYGNADLEYVGYTGSYINRREVTMYLRVTPGKYLVIPSLYEVSQLYFCHRERADTSFL